MNPEFNKEKTETGLRWIHPATGEILLDTSQPEPRPAQTRDDALRVLKNYLPGFKEPAGPLPELPFEDIPAVEVTHPDVNWHYHGPSGHSLGRDDRGRDYESSPDGKLTRIYSLSQKRQSVAFANIHGAAKAARKYDIPAVTIRKWITRGF